MAGFNAVFAMSRTKLPDDGQKCLKVVEPGDSRPDHIHKPLALGFHVTGRQLPDFRIYLEQTVVKCAPDNHVDRLNAQEAMLHEVDICLLIGPSLLTGALSLAVTAGAGAAGIIFDTGTGVGVAAGLGAGWGEGSVAGTETASATGVLSTTTSA